MLQLITKRVLRLAVIHLYYSYSIDNTQLLHCCSRRVNFQSRTKRSGQQHLVLTIKMQSFFERTRGTQVSHCFISHLKIVIESLLNEEFQHFSNISSFLVESAVNLKGTSSGLDSSVYMLADKPIDRYSVSYNRCLQDQGAITG